MERFLLPAALPALAAIFFLGSMVGGAIIGAFKLFSWSEDRVTKTALQVVQAAMKSDAFEKMVERIAAAAFTGRAEADNLFRAQTAADLREMRKRQDAQSESIVEAHRRIDSVLEKMFGAVSERAREVAAALGLVGGAKP
jgi:hypothetical protein